MRIAVIGGTGKEGRGLIIRWALAGHDVIIGSRTAAKAEAAAAESATVAPGRITGTDNVSAATSCELAVLTVPYAAHAETLKSIQAALAGKILVDITVPLQPPKVSQVHLPPGLSAALEAQAIVGPQTPVAAALHHVSSVHLADPQHVIDCDALFCTDDARARTVVHGLLKDLGLRPVDVGALRNAIALESITPLLLHINRTFKIPSAGIRITGLPPG
jgi:NADPH-dependent F420 reductase